MNMIRMFGFSGFSIVRIKENIPYLNNNAYKGTVVMPLQLGVKTFFLMQKNVSHN